MPSARTLASTVGVDRLQVDVADPVRVARHHGPVVAAGVGDVPGVEAQRHGGGVGELEEAGRCGRRCRRGRRRAGGTSAGRRARPAARGRVRSGPGRGCVHCSAVSSAGSSSAPVYRSVYIAGSVTRYGASIAASSAATWRHSASAASRASPSRCRAVPGGGAGQREAAAAELVAQLLGVGGQVAERAELDGGVAGRGGLVEEPVPGHLLRVVGEPDAPGVGGGAEPQVRQGGRAHGDFSLSQEAGAAWMAPAAGGRDAAKPALGALSAPKAAFAASGGGASAGVVRGVAGDLVDVGRVDEGRAGQHRLAAAEPLPLVRYSHSESTAS